MRPRLLDTMIVSDLVRRPQGVVATRIREIGEGMVCTSVVVAAELQYGAAKKGSTRLDAQLETVLDALQIMPFEPPADAVYGEIRAALERQGRMIGANDLLIAAHALAAECVLVTDNLREFSRVEGLTCENWIER